ncbi:hypothetical protein FF38_07844 [Lucilia cuprina]|uniref:Uncharacterized protein n=1 Tax=Lucilia cuprina TaxID=7375 RepID=A0A0L0BXW5_LUCCU|nr:hypothetical protein FF38_07844 [Lucilia cuprina]
MKVIYLIIFTLLVVSVSGKPTLGIFSRLHNFVHNIVHDEKEKPEKQVEIHYVLPVSSPMGNVNPYQMPGPYPAVNPYYPYNVQSNGYTHGYINNPYHQTEKMYEPSGPAGIYDNSLHVLQDKKSSNY